MTTTISALSAAGRVGRVLWRCPRRAALRCLQSREVARLLLCITPALATDLDTGTMYDQPMGAFIL